MAKRCNTCNTVRDLDKFTKDKKSKGGHLAKCKFCRAYNNQYNYIPGSREFYTSLLPKVKPDKRRTDHLRLKHSMTDQDYLDLLIAQDGKCNGCKADYKDMKEKYFHIKHQTNGKKLYCKTCSFKMSKLKTV